MHAHWILVLTGIGLAALLAATAGLLSRPAALSGAVLAGLVFAGTGLEGLSLLTGFFVLGALATRWGTAEKNAAGFSDDARDRGRNAGQVWANGGVGAICGLVAWIYPAQGQLCLLMMAGSFSAATADTVSSELGVLYGKKFYNIIRLTPDRRGENGVVSLEGTLLGMAGSALIALLHGWGNWEGLSFLFILVAGTLGNLADSLLGATLERKRLVGNDFVNWANTATGALTALLLFALFSNY